MVVAVTLYQNPLKVLTTACLLTCWALHWDKFVYNKNLELKDITINYKLEDQVHQNLHIHLRLVHQSLHKLGELGQNIEVNNKFQWGKIWTQEIESSFWDLKVVFFGNRSATAEDGLKRWGFSELILLRSMKWGCFPALSHYCGSGRVQAGRHENLSISCKILGNFQFERLEWFSF